MRFWTPEQVVLTLQQYSSTYCKFTRVGAIGEPKGEKTKHGWTIMSPGKEVDLSPMFFTQTSHVAYDNLYKLDVLGLADSSTGDQAEVYAEFKEQLTQDAQGCYETGLPWRGNHPPLPSNEVGSIRRLGNLVRKLRSQGTTERYDQVIQDQIQVVYALWLRCIVVALFFNMAAKATKIGHFCNKYS